MKTISLTEIKKELKFLSQNELIEICLRLAKFKVENKALLGYLLFDSKDEAAYIEKIKDEVALSFTQINFKTNHYIKKSVRKILRNLKKDIKYSKKKETEVELLIFFCEQLRNIKPYIHNNITLNNLYERQINAIKKALSFLHEDLQFDYGKEIAKLTEKNAEGRYL